MLASAPVVQHTYFCSALTLVRKDSSYQPRVVTAMHHAHKYCMAASGSPAILPDQCPHRVEVLCLVSASHDPCEYVILSQAHLLLLAVAVMTQSMAFSPYKKPFEERLMRWEAQLSLVSEVIDEWLALQRAWMYLEPIFSSPDILQQLPQEGKKYSSVDRIWRKVRALDTTQSYMADSLRCDLSLFRPYFLVDITRQAHLEW